jgi:DNA-binding transcriptional LysR family regulator
VIDIEVGTQRAIVNMVAGGKGIGIVDPGIASQTDGNLLTSRPLSPPLISTLAIVIPKSGAPSTIAQSFMHWFERQAG